MGVVKRSHGVALSTPRAQRPKHPGNRKLIAHELRALRQFFTLTEPALPAFDHDVDLDNWYDSWAADLYDAEMYKKWACFLRKDSNEAYEISVTNYQKALRGWNKRNRIAARSDPQMKAAQDAQIEEWGETPEERRQKGRVENMNAEDAAAVDKWQDPMRQLRLQGREQNLRSPH